MFVKTHLNEFNKIIMDLKNIDIKIDDEDQTIIVLCSLLASYEYFVVTLLYENDTISIEDVKASLHFRKLRKKVFKEEGEGQTKGLFMEGRTKKKCFGSDKGKSRSKSRRNGKM